MLVGGIMLYAGFSNWNKFKKIADLSTSKARSMAAGLVELSGKVLPAKKLVSPITKQECTYYRVEHQIYMRGRRGGGSWVTTNTKTECENFFLEDDTGKVEVDPKLAEIDIPLDKIEYNRKFLGAKERDIEYVLAKGDVAYVLGTAKNKPGVKTAKNEDNFIVTQGEGDKFFYISDKSEKDVRSNLSTSAYLLIGLGALAVIGSFAYIVYSFFAV
ncbi:MAG: GIDE domain-containing protein [Candidatus Micrarchaeota archaeon]|nr:GIDE domain-containing protein [Candidatus Micrarchaeota archaeon]